MIDELIRSQNKEDGRLFEYISAAQVKMSKKNECMLD